MKKYIPIIILLSLIVSIVYGFKLASLPRQIQQTFWRIKYEPMTDDEHQKVSDLVVKLMAAQGSGDIAQVTKQAKQIVCEPTEWEMTVNGHDETGRYRKLFK